MHSENDTRSTNWIDESSKAEIAVLLQSHGLLADDEQIEAVVPAGEGNMNVTLRVTTSTQSLVVKQSRPFVAKYPSIPAPVGRINSEALFYAVVADVPAVSQRMPRMLLFDRERHVIVLEDLGAARDATHWYNAGWSGEPLPQSLFHLVKWLAALHALPQDRFGRGDFRNLELRKLNHAHLFCVPFEDPPALDLDAISPGLTHASRAVRCDQRVRERCRELGELYLAGGSHLLHGDFFPGSWLERAGECWVIDPEFCFAGPAEFDLGIMIAHLRMMGCGEAAIEHLLETYEHPAGRLERTLVDRFAAVEVLRRLLGVAQLPLQRTLEERMQLINAAQQVLLA